MKRILLTIAFLLALVPSVYAENMCVMQYDRTETEDNSGLYWNVSTYRPLPVQISGTVNTSSSGGALASKQPALGTAGSPSSDVLTVQGIASMTALKCDGSSFTQPVSAASLPLPSGASTAAKQPALGTAGSASSDVLTVQGITSMTPLSVSISATGAAVFPEFDASKMVAPTVTTVANSQSASAITHGFTGSCRRVTVCNAGTTNPICIKFSNAWSRGLYLPARAATTSAMSCVSATNVTNIYGDSNTSTSPSCAGGSDVYVIPEDD